MRTHQRIAVLGALLALAGTACDDGKSGSVDSETDGGKTKDSGSEDSDGGIVEVEDAGDGKTRLVLTDWVESLVTERTNETSEPDTVDDKIVTDTDDPAAFNKYL